MGMHEFVRSQDEEESKLLNGWLFDQLLNPDGHLTTTGLSLLDRLADYVRVSDKQLEVTDLAPAEQKLYLKLQTRIGYRGAARRFLRAFGQSCRWCL